MTALTAVQPRAQHTVARAGSGSEPAAGEDFGAVLAAACCGSAPSRDASPADAPTADGPPADDAPTDETAAALLAAAPAGPAVQTATPATTVPVGAAATTQAAPESTTAELTGGPAAPAPAPTAPMQTQRSDVAAPPTQPTPAVAAAPVTEPAPTPASVATPAPSQPVGAHTVAVEPSPTEPVDASVTVEPEVLPPSAPAAPAPASAPVSAAAVDVVASGATAAGAPAPTSAVEATAPAPAPAAPPPAATQVLTAVGPVLEGPDGSYSMSLQLYPEELGAVQVEISLRNGELTLALHAADKDAVEVLRAAVSDLRAQLESTGVRSTDVSVDLGQGNRREPEDQRTARGTRPGDAAEAAPADEPTTTTTDRESAVDVRI